LLCDATSAFPSGFLCFGLPGVAERGAPGGARVVSTPAASVRENLYARFPYVVMGPQLSSET
jgi:hypothetical protein